MIDTAGGYAYFGTDDSPGRVVKVKFFEPQYYSLGTTASQVFDSGVGGSWYDSNWSYRREITIDRNCVQDVADPSSTYTDFPLLVYATGLSNILANGADIRFTSSDGITELPREIESYSGGALYAWIKVTLTKDSSDSSDDVIYMYYGNTFATEPPAESTYGAQNVWTSSYVMVLHLNETSGTHFDSTSSNNNANVNGTPIQDAAGQIAGGIEFRGVANEWIANNSALDTSNTFTIELWGNYQVTSNYQTAIWYQTSGSGWRELITIDSSSNIKSWWNGGSYGVDLLTDWDYDEWHHYVFTYDGNTVYVYKDGQYSSQVTTDYNSATGIAHWKIGDREDTNQPLDGTVDEYRFSMTNRNADWIQTSYNNQSTPSDFCSIGTEDIIVTAIWVALSWDETLAVNTDITFEVRASDTPFAKDAVSPSWTVIGGTSPVTSGLPSGRYMQWRATLTTSDPSNTPTLHEVIVFYD